MYVPIEQLQVIYAYGLGGRIDKEFAENGAKEYLHLPLVIDKNNYIIDGHHRYWYCRKNNISSVNVIRLDMTFEESRPWRTADANIKQFCRVTGNKKLYEQFKELTKCLT